MAVFSNVQDTVMDGLLSPMTGTFLAVSDHENDRLGHRICFTETQYQALNDEIWTWVYVVSVDPMTGDWVRTGIFDAWLAYGTRMVDSREDVIAIQVPPDQQQPTPAYPPFNDPDDRFSTFPNGAEWSLTSEPVGAFVYYSARQGGAKEFTTNDAVIRFVADLGSGTFDVPVDIAFVRSGIDRFLVNCSYSRLLADRILCYVSCPRYGGRGTPTWAHHPDARGTWCVHDPSSPVPIPSRDEQEVYPIPSGVRVRSSPVRPIPDVYALWMASVDAAGRNLTLSWFELRPDLDQTVLSDPHTPNPLLTKVVSAYDLFGDDLTLIGMGARRIEHLSDPANSLHVYVLYAVFTGPDGVGDRHSWVDSFLVQYQGSLRAGRHIGDDRVADVATAVTVLSRTRMVPTIDRAYELMGFRFINDDESFSTPLPNDEPFLVLVVSNIDGDVTAPSMILTMPAHEATQPYPTKNVVSSTRITADVDFAGNFEVLRRMDPEPMPLDNGQTVVIYEEEIPPGGTRVLLPNPTPREPGDRPLSFDVDLPDPRDPRDHVEVQLQVGSLINPTMQPISWVTQNRFRRAVVL